MKPQPKSVAEEILARHHAEWKAQIAATGQRAVKEWFGKTADSVPPPHVKARILLTWGRRCYLSGIQIRNKPWQIEHKHALQFCPEGVFGNRESNMRPALVAPHKEKTKKERSLKARADRMAVADAGVKEPTSKIPQRPKPERSTSKLDSIRALGGSEIARRYQDGK